LPSLRQVLIEVGGQLAAVLHPQFVTTDLQKRIPSHVGFELTALLHGDWDRLARNFLVDGFLDFLC
jgi:hypothetical protein